MRTGQGHAFPQILSRRTKMVCAWQPVVKQMAASGLTGAPFVLHSGNVEHAKWRWRDQQVMPRTSDDTEQNYLSVALLPDRYAIIC